MALHSFRPHFHFDAPLAVDLAVARLEELVKGDHPDYVGRLAAGQRHVELRMPVADRHLWSPSLSANLKEREGGSTRVTGLIGPMPNVWTAVAAINLGCVTGILFLATFGGVQMWLDRTPWAFLGVGILLLALVVVYLVAQAGQRIGAPQARHLRHLLEDALQLPEEERRRTDENPYHA
jgi:hypothetical protein